MNKTLIVILLLSLILRFYKLGSVPISLNWDEASNAYNAYSILKTGRDEFGTLLPLYNRSFDDYKPPLYMYTSILPVSILGLNEIASRLPSAVFGTLSILVVYLLTKRLTNNNKTALLSSASLAISPWSMHFSRVGFEANIGFFFTLLTLSVFLYALPLNGHKIEMRNKICLLLAALFAGISMYSYHSVRVFLPIMVLLTSAIYRIELFALEKKIIAIAILVGLLTTIPLFLFAPKEGISGRYATTSLKARVQDLEKSVNFISQDNASNSHLGNVIHNRRVLILQSTLQKYISHYDINFLFTSGDGNPRHHIRTNGHLFLFMLPLVLYGAFLNFKKNNRKSWLLILWLVVAPIPAAFGDAYPHAIRSYAILMPLVIFASMGLMGLCNPTRYKRAVITFTTAIIAITTFVYLHNYFVHYTKDDFEAWQFGYKESALQSIKLKHDYEKVIIDSAFEQGYIFWLFYSKFDPKTYQLVGSRNNFDKFYFQDNSSNNDNYLYVMPSSSATDTFNIIETIYNPKGEKAFVLGTK